MPIETALVHLHTVHPGRHYLGCGVLVEGPAIATSLQLWQTATQHAGRANIQLEVEFPAIAETCRAIMLARTTSAVLLAPDRIPPAATPLPLPGISTAAGEAFVLADAPGPNARHAFRVASTRIPGRIAATPQGLPSFLPADPANLPLTCKAAGAPVITRAGILAGIVLPPETETTPACIVPAAAIRHRLIHARIAATAAALKIPQAALLVLLDDLADPPISDIPDRLRAYVEELRIVSDEIEPPTHDDPEITTIIAAARARLAAFDPAGARRLLTAGIAAQPRISADRRLPLLAERADLERAAGDHAAARVTLTEMTRLDADDVWSWINLGDVLNASGDHDAALAAFRAAREAALRTGRHEDIALAYNRIGAVLADAGDRAGALHAYRTSVDLTTRLAAADPANALLQRNLSIRHDSAGTLLAELGENAAALYSFRAGRDIMARLFAADPRNADWQRDLSFCNNRIGSLLRACGDQEGALAAYRIGLNLAASLAATDPSEAIWQQDLAFSHSQVGHALSDCGDHQGAMEAYRACLSIRARLAATDPDNAEWRRDVILAHMDLADVDPPSTRRHLSAALALTHALEAAGRLAPGDADMAADLQSRLSALPPHLMDRI